MAQPVTPRPANGYRGPAPAKSLENPLAFPDELQALADMVTSERLRLEGDMHSPSCTRTPPGRCCVAASGGSNPRTLAALKELTIAYTTLGKELRQWSGHIKTNLDTMSPARKAQVMVQFVLDQPLSARRDIYQVLARREADRPDGLGIALVDRFAGPAPTHE